MKKAAAFAKDVLKSGVVGNPVGGATPGVMKYRKNGYYIMIGQDNKIISYGK